MVPYLACTVLPMPDLATDSGQRGRGIPPPARGACPSGHRPFTAADGLLVRVRVPGGEVSGVQAQVLARVAERDGSGVVEVTSRANLQVRGVAAGALPRLQADLIATGLLPADPALDERRNVVAAPAAGLDPTEVADVRPVTRHLVALLGTETRSDRRSVSGASTGHLPRLHPKAGVLVDGGGAVSLRGRRHDVALGAARRCDTGEIVAEVVLGGHLPLDPTDGDVARVAPLASAAAVAAAALAVTAGATGDGAPARVGPVVAAQGLPAVIRGVERATGITLSRVPAGTLDRARPSSAAPLGAHRSLAAGEVFVGAGPLLGRFEAGTLAAVAAAARRHGDGTVRLTPWRTVIIPRVRSGRAGALLDDLAALGLTVDPADPATTVVACVGASGCSSGLADTMADARRLIDERRANRAGAGTVPSVHLSGCAKRCASREVHDVTLVAIGGGHQDVFLRDPATGGERLVIRT